MGNVTFGGLASGMDTSAIVKAIMDSEKAPLNRLQKHQKINNERLEAYSGFNDKMKALETAAKDLSDEKKIQSSKSTLSSEDNISVESSGATMNGTYNVAVKQLSQVQKNVSAGFDSPAKNNMGTGTISFDIKDKDGNTTDTYDIDIKEGGNSLKGIIEAINKKSEDTGVTASLINDGKDSNNYHIVFSGKDAGTKFEIRSDLNGAEAGVDADFNTSKTTKTQEAQQAIAYIDGVEIVSNSNTLKNAVPGVDITLDKVNTVADPAATDPMKKYESTRLSVTPDNDGMKKKVDSFVSAYNGIMEYLKKGTKDTSSLNSYLRTDSSVANIKREMQGILTSTFGGENKGSMVMLSQAGIETQRDGTLKVDSKKLSNALEKNYTDFVNMFAGTEKHDGVMDKFEKTMGKFTDSIDGLYASKKKSHDSIDKSLDSQILRMESRLEKREKSLNAQFSAMEDMLASLNTQSSFLTSALTGM